MTQGENTTSPRALAPHEVITDHFVRAHAKWLTERTKIAVARHGHMMPTFVVVCEVDPRTGDPITTEKAPVPVLGARCRGEAAQRAIVEDMVFSARSIAIAGKARAVITCGLVWCVQRTAKADEVADVVVSTDPERREYLMTTIEWADDQPFEAVAFRVERDQGFVDFVPDDSDGMIDLSCNALIVSRHDEVPPEILKASRELAKEFVLTREEFDVRNVRKGVGNA